MSFEDFGKLVSRSLFLSLDRIVGPRLVKILYLFGVGAIVLWAFDHFFVTFRYGFGDGLWGLLEIAIFGVLGLLALRIVCEALIVYFKANESAVAAADHPATETNLIDEVRDAIEDLAADDLDDLPEALSDKGGKAKPASKASDAPAPSTRRPVRAAGKPRTAKRSPGGRPKASS